MNDIVNNIYIHRLSKSFLRKANYQNSRNQENQTITLKPSSKLNI